MRVLVVHNRYVSAVPSGENAVVDEEVAALRAAGVEVVTHIRSSDEIAAMPPLRKAGLALRPVRSGEDVRAVGRILREARPDVLHLHNPYPLVSPWVVRTAHAAGVPVVQTVHNYRHVCMAGSLFRDGHPCEDCVGRLPWPGVVHGCYRGSRPQSVALGAAQVVHRPTWRLVARYVALTAFARDRLAAAGIPRERVVVRPNSADDPGPPAPPGNGLLFVGRLDAEKGILLLLDAWRRVTPGTTTLTVVGDGRHREAVERLAAERIDVTYRGTLPAAEVGAAIDAAAAVVIPSVCYEGFPRLVAEAFARGRPILATAVGPLPSIVTPDVGWTAPAEPGAFAAAIGGLTGTAERGSAARARFLASYTRERTLAQLLDVYRNVAT
jgi:glycosyltransferase involved in cell wall biosynthesis